MKKTETDCSGGFSQLVSLTVCQSSLYVVVYHV